MKYVNKKNKGSLLVFSGPSGAGKGTLKNLYMNDFGEKTYFSVSATTRSPRPGEVDGVDYLFVTKDDFEKMIAADEFLEWAFVHGEYYGTPKAPAIENIANGKDVIFDIDVQGGLQIKSKLPEAVMIYITPKDTDVLEKRLRGRGTETEDKIQKRLNNAVSELEYIKDYDYVIVNEGLEEAYEKLVTVIKAHSLLSEYFEILSK